MSDQSDQDQQRQCLCSPTCQSSQTPPGKDRQQENTTTILLHTLLPLMHSMLRIAPSPPPPPNPSVRNGNEPTERGTSPSQPTDYHQSRKSRGCDHQHKQTSKYKIYLTDSYIGALYTPSSPFPHHGVCQKDLRPGRPPQPPWGTAECTRIPCPRPSHSRK